MEPIDELIRQAAPRAPRGIADAVTRRIAQQTRTRRGLAAAGVGIVAAAALVLWLVARPAPPKTRESSWVATSARASTADGRTLAAGAPLAVGAVVHVGDGGSARLERPSAGERARVELGANAEARVGDGAIELLSGSARLEGPEARLTGDVAEVTTLGSSAAATVELRRNPMTKTKLTLAALLTVGVLDGDARVQAAGHAPLLLAKNDRAVVAPKLPPLTTRAAAAAPAAAPAAKATAKPAAKPAARPAAQPASAATATADGALDKQLFRTAVQAALGDIRACYDSALQANEKLGGRFVVEMRLVTKGGKGHIADAEIQPDSDELRAPGLEQCILGALSRADFPPSVDGGDVIVHYPFVLDAGE